MGLAESQPRGFQSQAEGNGFPTLELLLWNSLSSPFGLGHTVFQRGRRPLCPSLPGKAIKLFFSTSPKTLISKVWFDTRVQRGWAFRIKKRSKYLQLIIEDNEVSRIKRLGMLLVVQWLTFYHPMQGVRVWSEVQAKIPQASWPKKSKHETEPMNCNKFHKSLKMIHMTKKKEILRKKD